MGLNLFVRKVVDKTTEETWGGRPTPFYQTETQEWFDPIRHSGDVDFVLENEFIFIDSDVPVEEQRLARPADFNKCREWVRSASIPDATKHRLLRALDKIETDENLVFSWAW